MHDYGDEQAELRESLSNMYSEAVLESASLEELRSLKEAMDLEAELDDFLVTEIEDFNEKHIRSKQRLIESVQKTRTKYQAGIYEDEEMHSPAFYIILDGLLEKFECKIQYMTLPDPLNDWWSYSYEITAEGINLLMNHFSWEHDTANTYRCQRNAAFMLLQIPAKLLTVSEYARAYDVEPVTVRQWIRRAKIRSAVKVGREWRIPELSEVSRERGYCPCRYIWSESLVDVPEKYGFLSAFKSARFYRDKECSDFFRAKFASNEMGYPWDEDYEALREELRDSSGPIVMDDGTLRLTAREREELELYMIGNPLIRCTSIHSREGSLAYGIVELGNDYGDGFLI